MNGRTVWAVIACTVVFCAAASPATAQNFDAKEYRLDNGMQVLMVERHEAPTIMASVFARVGSSNERTGITGISHLFEHMMFKGTETIGTKDIKRDREIMAQLDSLRELMRAEQRIMREQYRRGEITDMKDPEAKTARYKEIDAIFDSLILEQRELIIKDQLDELYSKNGGFFLNAFTSEDMTGYFVRLPKNKIELWMWLESDRFKGPVFREFYSERDVVREERRLGVESTPTGLIEEDFTAMFWKSSSYHWDVIGWASDLDNITREQANQYYGTYYAPNNLVMILVGDFVADEMIKLVREYFDRLPRGKVPPPDVTTLEEPQHGEKRLIAEAEASPQAEIWYHTVAWKNRDSYPLEVLAKILSDKTGRLYKKLVEEKGIAKSSGGRRGMFGGSGLAVGAEQDARRYAGAFRFNAEGISGVRAEQLEAAMYEVIEDIQANPVSVQELQKAKNQLRVDKIRFMDLMSGIGVLFVVGQNAVYGDWTEANNNPAKCDMVTAADVQRVAKTYFAKDQRNVLVINTKGEGGGEDPMFTQMVQRIKSVTDATELQQMIGMLSMRAESIEDPAEKEQMQKLLEVANEHLKTLKAAENK
ncbi:MAG TPA: pitrilysin family protein [Acidobacteriota bacterium]|nr:pitrilysin family protein [Acidobacteriota bacterium]